MPVKRKSGGQPPGKSSQPTKKRRQATSVWNTPDDWPQLVADSSLSTSSISTRQPRPRGLQTLIKCAADACSRHFRLLWEDTLDGETWKAWWSVVPDHLKVGVRDGIFKLWGGYLTQAMIRELFVFPPSISIPGHLLPSTASATHLKPLHPLDQHKHYTSLTIQYLDKAMDVAIAGLIHHLPNLEDINFKGCALAGDQTVRTILERCSGVKRLNLKGTKISEQNVQDLFERFREQLDCFKIDNVSIQHPEETFASAPYPHLTHLCIPGNAPAARKVDTRAARYGQMVAPPMPRYAVSGAQFDWPNFITLFPSLTHLYLPALSIPSDLRIQLQPHTLQKLSLGPGGPPVCIGVISQIVASQHATLKSLHLRHIAPEDGDSSRGIQAESGGYRLLGELLAQCEVMEDFRWEFDEKTSLDTRSNQGVRAFADVIYTKAMKGPWRKSIKHLALRLPQAIDAGIFNSSYEEVGVSAAKPALERLELPSARINTASLVENLCRFPLLRSVGLSETSVTEEEVFRLLDACPFLSRIDLTSCRGVKVQHRRNIFKAWKESRS